VSALAAPTDGCFELENEGTPDEFRVGTCENCGEPIMTLIGQDEDEWVHERTESPECEVPERKWSKAELAERVELLEGLLADAERQLRGAYDREASSALANRISAALPEEEL
jgi:hypothetical protein